MNQKLSLGEPFIETRYLEAEESFPVTLPAILINPDQEQDVIVNNEFILGPLKAMIIRDVTISVPGKALLIVGFDTLRLSDRLTMTALCSAWKSNYQLTGLPEHRTSPYFKSPQETLENVSINYCLVADPDAPSGIHREHADPTVKELHVQIVGEGAVDLMKSRDPSSLYASLPLTAGSTHISTWNKKGAYTWHRYRSVTPCIFLSVEIH
ncbi:MAG: hypothetical protein LUC27_02565 [Lachnospiraceae bacterium]|nr:hypothetical protein [Lachnospiraceae bacterium]